MPYPPSFSRIPARIIDPATGASTWAFGSHRWVINMGVFTKKAKIVANHQRLAEVWVMAGREWGRHNDRCPE